jgi:hypothetical protein
MKSHTAHAWAYFLAAWQVPLFSANNASPETYDVALCGGRGTIQVQLVGSAGASFEINAVDNCPILRVDDVQDRADCAVYVYASVSDAGEVVASAQAVDSASDMGDHDYHADLNRMYNGLQVAQGRRLELDAAVPVPVPIAAASPSGARVVMRNLVVLVRFADHVNRCLPSVSDIDKLFNSDTYTYDASGVPVRTRLAASALLPSLARSIDRSVSSSLPCLPPRRTFRGSPAPR